jgi:hypothetical protein
LRQQCERSESLQKDPAGLLPVASDRPAELESSEMLYTCAARSTPQLRHAL